MLAVSVARLTDADSTPSVRNRKRSMRLTHEAHVIPAIGRRTSTGGAGASVAGSTVVAGAGIVVGARVGRVDAVSGELGAVSDWVNGSSCILPQSIHSAP